MNGNIIGIDIGATKVHLGLVNGGELTKESIIPTSAEAPKEQIILEIIQAIEGLSDNFEGIGIGVPGLIDEEKGIVYDLSNIPSWKEVFLKEHLEEHFNKPVRITNDANTFALGEKIYGQGIHFKNMVGITLGSGFGTGIIIDGKLYSGTLSSAGELADIPYMDKTIEDYCSGKFFKNQMGMEGGKLFKLAQKGDGMALKAFDEYGKHLGNAITLILKILSPEAVFLGGSVSKSFAFFESSLKRQLKAFPFSRVLDKLVLAPSEVEHISILGSAALLKWEIHHSKEQDFVNPSEATRVKKIKTT